MTIKLCTKFRVVSEKPLTEKSLQTDKHSCRKGKTLYPLYTSYRGYKYSLDAAAISLLREVGVEILFYRFKEQLFPNHTQNVNQK